MNDPELIVYLNGRFVPESEAQISVLDHSFLYGDGVFEGISVDDGRIFKLHEHVSRLFRSAEYLRIVPPASREKLCDLIAELVVRNDLREGYVRSILTRGTGPMGIGATRTMMTPTVVMIPQRRPRLSDEQRLEKGLRAKVLATRRVPPECIDPRVKANNYLNQILGKLEHWDAGADAGIMLDTQGYVAECCGENVFVVTNGVLRTPPPQTVLDGITRQTIIELWRGAGNPVREERLTLYDLYTADEAFMTATLIEVAALTSIDGHAIGDGSAGPATRDLLRLLREEMARGARTVGFGAHTRPAG